MAKKRSKKWHESQSDSARAYMDLTTNLPGRQAVLNLVPDVLDSIARIATLKSKTNPHAELVELDASLHRQLRNEDLVSSSDAQHNLRMTYFRAEQLALPASVIYRDLRHRLQGVTSSFHLDQIGLSRMQALDELAAGDEHAAVMHKQVMSQLTVARDAVDCELPQKLSRVFEAFSEMWAYRHLKERLNILKVPESVKGQQTPDFKCELDGREFYIEVKAPDIVDGNIHHKRLMEEAMNAQIELEGLLRAGSRVASAARIISPFGNASGTLNDYDDLTVAIEVVRKRARSAYGAGQFSSGPTFALMVLDRYPIPGNRQCILPDYHVGGMWADAPDDRQSGILWQAAFGTAGNTIHNLTAEKKALMGEPFMRDVGRHFPGVGFIGMNEIDRFAGGKTECWGLLDRSARLPAGWDVSDSEAVLDAVCDVWNDDADSRPKWQDE